MIFPVHMISRWQGGIVLGSQSKCGHLIMNNNPTPCKIAQPSGEVAGSHFVRSLTAFHLTGNEGISFDVR